MSTRVSCRKVLRASVLALALGTAAAEGGAASLAAAIVLEPVFTSAANLVFITHAGDGSGRLCVLEQAGTIKVFQSGSTDQSVFLDIRSKVFFSGERGLLGLAFHPGFETNRRFFVNYTRLPDGATVIAEYHASAADPNVADPAETVLLTIAQPYPNHNGGMIAFGPDGYLYIGMVDGGNANDPGDRAQNVEELLGKILRIDVDHPASATQLYSSPADNPFAGAVAGRDEIYAYGFRNPWRYSFDRQNGDLMAGDVGQNVIEEIDRVVKGGNYGWRTFEGTRCTGNDPTCDPSPFIMPITQYDHSGGRCSVTGGYVYRGSRGTLPPGSYVYGDFCSGEIFLLEGTQVSLLASPGFSLSSFGEDAEGELYVVDYSGVVYLIAAPPVCSGASIAPRALAFTPAGGSGVVNVTAAAGCDWTASTTEAWVVITEGAAGSGNGTVRYDVAPNEGTRQRVGLVRIAGQVHTVVESAPPRCLVDLEPRRIAIGPGGGSGAIAVTARGEGCRWSAESPAPWIALTSGASGSGSGSLQYSVAPNTSGIPRQARLRVGNRTVVVRQQ